MTTEVGRERAVNTRWAATVVDERIRIAYSHLRNVSIGSLITSSAVALIVRGMIDDTSLLVWLAAVWLNAVGRMALARRFHARPRAGAELRSWHIGLGVVLAAASLIYASILWLTPGEPPLLVIAALGLAIGGTIAGAVLALAATPRVLAAVTVCLSTPLLVACASSSQSEVRYFLIMFVSFLFMTVMTGRQNHRTLVDSLTLRYENLELAERLAERNVAEAAARAAAESANHDKTRFLAAASHDLRQPLHALALFVSALAQQPRGASDAHIIGRIQLSLEALQQLLDGLLDISRLDAGVLVPRPRPVAAAAIGRHIEQLFGELARSRQLRLRVAPSTLWVSADPDMLSQIVRNLVANAIRYTRSGGVLVAFRRRADLVRVEVWDTGIGIPADAREQIFREFVQLGNPERDRAQGVGLGLAIVDRLTRLLGTRVHVRSEPGRGSVFWFELPVAAPGGVESTQPAPSDRTAASRGTVLVIDDDALAREGLTAALESWGFTVLAAASEKHAHELAARSDFDAIVCDMRLPGERTGVDVVTTLTARAAQRVPAIIVTGETEPERIRAAHASGYPVLFKPVVPGTLRATLDSSLSTPST